jgi:hypothetical protein
MNPEDSSGTILEAKVKICSEFCVAPDDATFEYEANSNGTRVNQVEVRVGAREVFPQ